MDDSISVTIPVGFEVYFHAAFVSSLVWPGRGGRPCICFDVERFNEYMEKLIDEINKGCTPPENLDYLGG